MEDFKRSFRLFQKLLFKSWITTQLITIQILLHNNREYKFDKGQIAVARRNFIG